MVDLLGCHAVGPGMAPHTLPLQWRALYELVDLYDELCMVPKPCVLERQLAWSLQDVIGAPPKRPEVPASQYVDSLDPRARDRLRSAIDELRQAGYVVRVNDDGEGGRRFVPTSAARLCVARWRRHWIALLVELAAEPRGWRKWLSELLSPPTVSNALSVAIGAILGAVGVHFLH